MWLLSVANDCVVKDYVNSENLYLQKSKQIYGHIKKSCHTAYYIVNICIYIYFLLNATFVSD